MDRQSRCINLGRNRSPSRGNQLSQQKSRNGSQSKKMKNSMMNVDHTLETQRSNGFYE